MAATVGAVAVVHGRNVGQQFAFDDYVWLERTPSGAGDVIRVLRPPNGAGIYRPFLDLWFDATQAVFGPHPLAFHVFALCFAVGLALSIRWLCRELGLGVGAATVAGIFAGTNGCLVIATLWASAAPSLAMGTCAAMAIAFVQRPGLRREIVAAAFLVAAILWRDAAIVVPAVAAILIVARPDTPPDLAVTLRATASLWMVSIAYGAIRVWRGLFSGSSDDLYHSELGTHLGRNLWTMVRYTGQFGMVRGAGTGEKVAMAALVLASWGVLIVGSLMCLRRRLFLPVAGLAAYAVGILPFLGLTNHAMESYYLEVAVIGLAVTVGGLVQWWLPRGMGLVVVTAVFVMLMAGAAKVVDDRHWINVLQARAEVLTEYARRFPVVGNTLVVGEACAIDSEAARDGALFRVVLGRSDLRVRTEVIDPDTAPVTPWGCRTG